MKALAPLSVLLVALAGSALADGAVVSKMTADDKARLAGYATTREKALAEARATGAPKDLATLDAALAGKPLPLRNVNIEGEWRCRTIKLGGLAPALVVYGWFKCRLYSDAGGLWLDKATGSQRTRGQFYDDGDRRMIYLGALYYSDEKPRPYGGDPKRDQIAYVFRVDAKRLRLEFPSPQYESLMDIVELTRP